MNPTLDAVLAVAWAALVGFAAFCLLAHRARGRRWTPERHARFYGDAGDG